MKKRIVISCILLILGFTNIFIAQNSNDTTQKIDDHKSTGYIYVDKNKETYICISSVFNHTFYENNTAFVFNKTIYNKIPESFKYSIYFFKSNSIYNELISEFDNLYNLNKSSKCDSNYQDEIVVTINKNGIEKKRFCFNSKEDIISCIKLLYKYFDQPIAIRTEMEEKYMKNENVNVKD